MGKIEGINIINVFYNKTPEQKKEIIEFWLKEKAIQNIEAAKKRVEEVSQIARDKGTGEIVAITTTYEQFNKQLENFFFYLRVFTGEKARQLTIAKTLVNTIKDFLEKNFVAGKITRSIGMIMEVESKILQVHKNEAVWPATKFVYIGKNEKGDHVRVYYFKDARIS